MLLGVNHQCADNSLHVCTRALVCTALFLLRVEPRLGHRKSGLDRLVPWWIEVGGNCQE